MIATALCFAYCGGALICSAMQRHRRDILDARLIRYSGVFSGGGWAFLLAALAASIEAWPFWQGVVASVLIIGIAASAVVLVVTFYAARYWLALGAAAGLGVVALLIN